MSFWTPSCGRSPDGNTTKWLAFTVSQAPPEPLEWSELKMAKPEGSNHELGRINREDDEDLAGARHASKITEAVPVKDRGADDGLQDVIRKSRPANRGHPLLQRCSPRTLAPQHDQSGPAH